MERPLKVGFLAASVVVFVHDFIPAGIHELSYNAGKLWELLYKLALAFLASFVFYYFNVHLPRQRDRENLRPFLNRKTFRIVEDALHQSRGLRYTSGHDISDAYPSLHDLKIMCSKVHPYADAPLTFGNLGRNANWMEYLSHFRNSTKETARTIYTVTSFLDTDYLELVMDIDDCHHFLYLKDIAAAP